MKRLFCLLLFLAFLLTGCDIAVPVISNVGNQPTGEEGAGNDLSFSSEFGLPYNSDSPLSPLSSTDRRNLELLGLIYDGLYSLDQSFSPIPQLVVSAVRTGSRWVFTLREGVQFHDGSPLTAKDAVYTINTMRDTSGCVYSKRLSSVASCSELSELSFEVTLTGINELFPSLLDIPVLKDGGGTGTPIGTGRYRYVESGDGRAYLAVNGSWYGVTPGIERIELVASGTDTLPYQFSNGDVGAVFLDSGDPSRIEYSGGYAEAGNVTNQLSYIGVNAQHPQLSSPALRRAVSLSVNRPRIIDEVLLGSGYLTYLPVNPAWYLFDLSAVGAGYDTAQAKQLLLDAGYVYTEEGLAAVTRKKGAPQPLTLRLLVNRENSARLSAAKLVATSLASVGVTVEITEATYSEYQQALTQGDFDLYMGEVRVPADMDLRFLIGTGGALNYGGYSDEGLDAKLSALYASGSEASVKDAAASLLYALDEQMPVIPLYYSMTSLLLRSNVTAEPRPTASCVYNGLEQWKLK